MAKSQDNCGFIIVTPRPEDGEITLGAQNYKVGLDHHLCDLQNSDHSSCSLLSLVPCMSWGGRGLVRERVSV